MNLWFNMKRVWNEFVYYPAQIYWAWFVHFYPKVVDNLILYIIRMLAYLFLHFRFSKIAKMLLYSPSFFRLFKTYLIFISSLIVRFSFNPYQKWIWTCKNFCRSLVFWVYLFKFSEFIDDALLYTLFSISNLIVRKTPLKRIF